ncbi:MAG: FAD-dependent oxidoreductase [Oscillospiraceae bacterium]|nr:FAD-dependent oxidoreductase [Oscillospiraceae bacterium]
MDWIARTNEELKKQFAGRYTVRREKEHLVLEGGSGDWQEIVEAGFAAARAAKGNIKGCLVNDVRFTGEQPKPMRLPNIEDQALEGMKPDVLVIGGGVVGCAIARELTRWKLDVLLAEKECDVALHTSARNDGMVHPGLDLRKSKLKYWYNKRGNEMYDRVCGELEVPFARTGQLLCFPKGYTPLLYLFKLYWNNLEIPSVVLKKKALYEKIPDLDTKLGCALLFPTAGSVCPYGLTIAFAENAIENGAVVSLNTAVLGMELEDRMIKSVRTNRGTVYPKVVVNAAGVFSEDVAAMAGDRFFSIHPRRGTNSILDKKASHLSLFNLSPILISHLVGSHTKGGGIIRTIHGNLLLGPDAVETPEKENFATLRDSIDNVLHKQRQTIGELGHGQIITYFTGVRAATFEEDFVIRRGLYTENIVHAAGIQSPGLTAAPAIAEDITRMVLDQVAAEKNESFNPHRKAIVNAAELPEEERSALIAENPDYGVILCRCEQVSRGEIAAALKRPLPCDSVDGVKRRVRAGMGRCQGGFCGPQVAQVIAKELNIPLEQVRKSGAGSEVLLGATKGGDTHV